MEKDTNYLETYYEITAYIESVLSQDYSSNNVIEQRYEEQGSGSKYELAEEWTNDFEKIYEDIEWGVGLDWYDTLHKFLQQKNVP